VTLVAGEGREEEEIVALCHEAQVILSGSAPKITASVIRQLPNLKAIVRYGIGVDSVSLVEATRRKILVANVPDYCVEEVATHAMTLILAWTRKLPSAMRSVAKGGWTLESLRPLQSARDLVVGLVGFGRIAQRVARMAQAIGFRVVASDPYVSVNSIRKRKVEPVSFAGLIKQADFISLHLPLSARTRHFINAGVLRRMKPTAYLINTARGELVDEQALYFALEQGQIAGAALDVVENEPWVERSPLRALDSVVITPHCAWYTERSQRVLRENACAEVARILRGKAPKNLVNGDVLS
jgi:D-3-phosphoglycerate dehydrogenase